MRCFIEISTVKIKCESRVLSNFMNMKTKSQKIMGFLNSAKRITNLDYREILNSSYFIGQNLTSHCQKEKKVNTKTNSECILGIVEQKFHPSQVTSFHKNHSMFLKTYEPKSKKLIIMRNVNDRSIKCTCTYNTQTCPPCLTKTSTLVRWILDGTLATSIRVAVQRHLTEVYYAPTKKIKKLVPYTSYYFIDGFPLFFHI